LTTGTQGKNASYSPTVLCVAYEDEGLHKFKLESMGIWHPHTLVSTGLKKLLSRCVAVKDSIVNGNVGQKYKGQYMAVDYLLAGQSHTLGNMLQEWIYKHEFNGDNGNINHVSYHEPHPLENAIVFRLSLNTEDIDFENYKRNTDDIMVTYIDSLYEHLNGVLEMWMNTPAPRNATLL
jgi:DNA-directed RNA polymerase subunit L